MLPSGPDSIAGFKLTEPLGRGAFGAVYRARHAALDIDVAVKLIDIHALASRVPCHSNSSASDLP